MRFIISVVSILLSWAAIGQIPSELQFALSTGSTSYLGNPTGPGSAGTFLSTATVRWDVLPNMRTLVGVSNGGFGLTATPYNRSTERISEAFFGFQIHPEWQLHQRITPSFGLGIGNYRQVVWADQLDATGTAYHVWSDGQTYDMAEDALYASFLAQPVQPDYIAETKERDTRSWGTPMRIGVDWEISDQLTLEAASSTHFGISPTLFQNELGSIGTLTSFEVGIGWRPGANRYQDQRIPSEYLARNLDTDRDGVNDRKDQCFSTPIGVHVNEKGCPIDTDGDGVADYLDFEPNSQGLPVDGHGVYVLNLETTPVIPTAVQLDFKQVVAEPATGDRPHLPVGQALLRDKTPAQNRSLDLDK